MWGDDFHKKFQILDFFFLHFNHILLNIKRQSEHSGLRPDTSSLVCICILIAIVAAYWWLVLVEFQANVVQMLGRETSYLAHTVLL